LGDVPRLNDEPAVVAAVDRAGAGDVVARLASGLDTQLGPTWPSGVELIVRPVAEAALARGFMPAISHCLLVLDAADRRRWTQ
jgi:ATP-binding cassette subfamily B protein